MEKYLKEQTRKRQNNIWRSTHKKEIRQFNIIIGLVIFLFVLLRLSIVLH
jgi:hypothetical protein